MFSLESFKCGLTEGKESSDLNPCLCSQDGETPLIKATKMRNIEVVELLLDKGAKVSAVDKVRAGLCMAPVVRCW